MSQDYLVTEETCLHLRVSRPKLLDIRKNDPDFPKPFKLGGMGMTWRKSELDAYMDLVRERTQ